MLIPGSHFLDGPWMSTFLALISINYKVITFLDLNAASNTAPVVRVVHNRQSILGNAWQSMPQLPKTPTALTPSWGKQGSQGTHSPAELVLHSLLPAFLAHSCSLSSFTANSPHFLEHSRKAPTLVFSTPISSACKVHRHWDVFEACSVKITRRFSAYLLS